MIVDEEKRTAKKMAEGVRVVTRQPWTYGSLPADPVAKKVADRPATALWDMPKVTAVKESVFSTGDPILDSLIAQLKSHGASGIAGLARKFKIMDDDGSGALSMDEFKKGMKECELVDLSDKAISHLFRYFG